MPGTILDTIKAGLKDPGRILFVFMLLALMLVFSGCLLLFPMHQSDPSQNQPRQKVPPLDGAYLRTTALLRWEHRLGKGTLEPEEISKIGDEIQIAAETKNWHKLRDYAYWLKKHAETLGAETLDKIFNSPHPMGLGRALLFTAHYGGPPSLIEDMQSLGAKVSGYGALGREFSGAVAVDRLTPLHAAINGAGDAGHVKILLSLGADPNAIDYLGRTPLHLAGLLKRYDLIPDLCAGGADPNSLYSRTGQSAAEMIFRKACVPIENGGKVGIDGVPHALPAPNSTERRALEAMLKHGGDPYLFNRKRETLLGSFLAPPSQEVLAFIAENTDWESLRYRHPELSSINPDLCKQSIKRICEAPLINHGIRLRDLDEDVYISVREFFNRGRNLEHTADFLAGAAAALVRPKNRPFVDDPGLTRILPQLLLNYDPWSFNSIAASIERLMDAERESRGAHPYEAEMMVLLKHAEREKVKSFAGPVTLALTSVFRFIDNSIFEIPEQTVRNWADIGAQTFSWTKWKYESQHLRAADGSVLPSLFEKYGLKLVEARPTDEVFGRGYILAKGVKPNGRDILGLKSLGYDDEPQIARLDPETHIELRRGYFLVHNRSRGTLLIRNSSRVFGRDRLIHPAYYAPPETNWGQSLERLGSLTVEDIDRPSGAALQGGFHPLLKAYVLKGFPPLEVLDMKLRFLIDELNLLQRDIKGWAFDTRRETSWLKSPFGGSNPELFGGYLSPGFRSFVESAVALSNAAVSKSGNPQDALDLAFVDPTLPPWRTYGFNMPDGWYADRLKITPEVGKVLLDLASLKAKEEDLRRTGIRNFLQQAGFNHYAELVLLSPLEER